MVPCEIKFLWFLLFFISKYFTCWTYLKAELMKKIKG